MEAFNDPALLERLQPAEFYSKWAEAHFPQRPDGRHALEFRPLAFTAGVLRTADSSATVRIGETMAIAAIRAEVAEPELSKPNMGYAVANVTLCSGCSVSVRAGPPTDRAQMLTHQISNLLVSLNVIPLQSLIIIPGKLAWCLHIDSFVISDTGNAFDAAWISILHALRTLKLPNVRMDAETLCATADPSVFTAFPFPTNVPLCVSFRWLSSKSQLIVDPTDTEESIMEECATIFVASDDCKTILHVDAFAAPLDAILHAVTSPNIQNHLAQLRNLLA